MKLLRGSFWLAFGLGLVVANAVVALLLGFVYMLRGALDELLPRRFR